MTSPCCAPVVTGLQAQLRELERKQLAGESLNADEKRLRERIVASSAGEAGVIGYRRSGCARQRGIRERFARGPEIGARYDQRFREIFQIGRRPQDPPTCRTSNLVPGQRPLCRRRWHLLQFMPSTAKSCGRAII